MNVPMWYSQMVKVNGLLPALGPAGFYRPYKLTYLLINNQPLILLRFPSPRDNHKHSSTIGNRLVAITRRLPVSSRCGLDKNKKNYEKPQCPTSTSFLHLRIYCPSQNSFPSSTAYAQPPTPMPGFSFHCLRHAVLE